MGEFRCYDQNQRQARSRRHTSAPG